VKVAGNESFEMEKLLVKGIAACFKLLIIATFRVPWLSSGQTNLWKLSGHTLLVACTPFLQVFLLAISAKKTHFLLSQRHEVILALLILFDINIGALDSKTTIQGAEESDSKGDKDTPEIKTDQTTIETLVR
jgi:hypothetical protein